MNPLSHLENHSGYSTLFNANSCPGSTLSSKIHKIGNS